ncbi:MAG: DnaJ domain-containing protein, partial [Pseudomonadota bacterium]
MEERSSTMARDPYTVLGVSKSASEGEVKSAYRRLAKRYHPDTNADDPKAQERFAEVNAAYEVVGDKDKRKQFDRGEIDADGKPRFAGFSGGGSPFGFGGGEREGSNTRTWTFSSDGTSGVDEILREFMGGGRARGGFSQSAPPRRGEDLDVGVTVTLEDLVSEEKLRVALPNGRTVDVKIPAGAEPEQQIRLRGLGLEAPGAGEPGDALLTLHIAAHPTFRRDGANLRLDLPI